MIAAKSMSAGGLGTIILTTIEKKALGFAPAKIPVKKPPRGEQNLSPESWASTPLLVPSVAQRALNILGFEEGRRKSEDRIAFL